MYIANIIIVGQQFVIIGSDVTYDIITILTFIHFLTLLYRSSHYPSPYPTGESTAILSQQSAMMGIQQPATTYYDPGSMQHMGMHGDHGAMSHTTRAHPQTVSFRF